MVVYRWDRVVNVVGYVFLGLGHAYVLRQSHHRRRLSLATILVSFNSNPHNSLCASQIPSNQSL